MQTDDGQGAENQVDMVEGESVANDQIAYSDPLSGPLNKRTGLKSARFNIPTDAPPVGDDEVYVEIMLDVRDDSVAMHRVKPAGSGECEDPEVALARNSEKRCARVVGDPDGVIEDPLYHRSRGGSALQSDREGTGASRAVEVSGGARAPGAQVHQQDRWRHRVAGRQQALQ
ncbi:hypothetical protein J5N97_024706 [Dioscorea zingiberensis]|uniref:Uncharacterized protein n=1 Tax=Dioscorea zingiberensis TaxID=325984 RepID=A0A9D5H900_9LILI|nr:hypothetical protein J5N97_024706 [Dioscorea zingiberensis]